MNRMPRRTFSSLRALCKYPGSNTTPSVIRCSRSFSVLNRRYDPNNEQASGEIRSPLDMRGKNIIVTGVILTVCMLFFPQLFYAAFCVHIHSFADEILKETKSIRGWPRNRAFDMPCHCWEWRKCCRHWRPQRAGQRVWRIEEVWCDLHSVCEGRLPQII